MQMASPWPAGPAGLLSPASVATLNSSLSRTVSRQQLASTHITLPTPTTTCGTAHLSGNHAADSGQAASTAPTKGEGTRAPTRKLAVLQGLIPESPAAPEARKREKSNASNIPAQGAATGASTLLRTRLLFGMPTAGLDGGSYVRPGGDDGSVVGAAGHNLQRVGCGMRGGGMGAVATKIMPALKTPVLPAPLTPMGYTPRRTQLDESTLQYLMQKWGGRQLKEALA
jgi:hypothetical protein